MSKDTHQYASPPCFMHEDLAANEKQADLDENRDVKRWRKAERQRLIAARPAEGSDALIAQSKEIARHLDELIPDPTTILLGTYWPFRSEPDLHPWFDDFRRRGGRTALPQVVAKGVPLVFRLWEEGARMERGAWDIPFPADGAEVVPDMVIAPLVGFDEAGYRLGYGSGFFDRTLAALPVRPKAIGVGYDQAAIKTIYPQWHDIPMDAIVTESGRRSYAR